MKKIFIILLASVTISSVAQVELKHGLIFGVGQGSLSGLKTTPNISQDVWDGSAQVAAIFTDYKYNAMLGYKFRLQPVNGRSFYDIDAGFSFKTIEYSILPKILNKPDDEPIAIRRPDGGKDFILFTSLSLIYNYNFYKGLYAGIGIAPTYCHDPDPLATNRFDVPVIVKVGYDFRRIDLSLSYKFGTTNVLKDQYLTSGRINDWQLQLFIPF